MIITSVSLPKSLAPHWRDNRREIMGYCIRMLRIMQRSMKPKTGATIQYTQGMERCVRVTTRFTEAEHDTLLYESRIFRVSMSWIIAHLIRLWLKIRRRVQKSPYVSKFSLDVNYVGPVAVAVAETLMIWRKTPLPVSLPS